MQVRFLKFALAAVATTFVSAGAFAGPYDGCTTIALGIQHCWSPSQVSRDEVKGDLQAARATGALRQVGELADASAAQREANAPSTLTRAQVRRELLDAERDGQMQFGDLGRTQAEWIAQREGLKPHQARTDIATSR